MTGLRGVRGLTDDLASLQVTYNVKASIRQIETWGKVKEGYLSLLWCLL